MKLQLWTSVNGEADEILGEVDVDDETLPPLGDPDYDLCLSAALIILALASEVGGQ